MGLKTFVKISNVSNLSDARYCAGMGVNVMGFNIDPESEEKISADQFEAITGWISGVEYAGEIKKSLPELDYLRDFPLDYIQIEHPVHLDVISNYQIPVIMALNIDEMQPMEAEKIIRENVKRVAFFLIQSSEDSVCEHLHTSIFKLAQNYPIVLGCGINKDNINTLIDNTALKGIGLKGSEEIKPGFKDFDELAEILETIEIEDNI
jgi:phosphoribosylanthranilate isomerase